MLVRQRQAHVARCYPDTQALPDERVLSGHDQLPSQKLGGGQVIIGIVVEHAASDYGARGVAVRQRQVQAGQQVGGGAGRGDAARVE